MSNTTKTLVVLASGYGSTFQSIIDAIVRGEINANIRALVTDRECQATARAREHGIDFYVLYRKNEIVRNLAILSQICEGADLIVSAGYLSIISDDLIQQFPNKIINTHPTLLPKYGGRGMYGLKVHQAVLDAGETESGCTIHVVDSGIDTGTILAQAYVDISPLDDAKSLQAKIQSQEHQLLPRVINTLLNQPL